MSAHAFSAMTPTAAFVGAEKVIGDDSKLEMIGTVFRLVIELGEFIVEGTMV